MTWRLAASCSSISISRGTFCSVDKHRFAHLRAGPPSSSQSPASRPNSTISTGTKTGTRSNNSMMSLFRMRTQPIEPGVPIATVSGEPCR
jgi:hypothetical protein